MRRAGLLLLAALLWIPFLPPAPAAADHGVTAESPACGYPRFYLPEAGTSGSLPDSFPIRGPAGALFGRTLGAVRRQLVEWPVPMSEDVRVKVHRRLLPVLDDVEANLLLAAASGRRYVARDGQTWGFNARTSVAHEAISYHGLGAAIDINSTTNPYRRDGILITDMPRWYTRAWEAAGMCWGGNWWRVKDPMHFSWVGPVGSPAYTSVPRPVPPLTSAAPFSEESGDHEVVFGSNANPQFVLDASGDGAPDVAHIRPWRDDAVLELATSRRGYAACSIWRWWLEDPPPGEPVFADVDGVGRPDLLFAGESDGRLVFRRYAVMNEYAPTEDVITAVPAGSQTAFGDVDRDGAADLWAIEGTSDGMHIEIWSASSSYTESIARGILDMDMSGSTRLATADRDVDGRYDLMMVRPGSGRSTVVVVSADDLSVVDEVVEGAPVGEEDRTGFQDYDGDGRPDLQVFDDEGVLRAWRGNTPLAGVDPTSWFLPADFDCPDGTLPYFHDGPFADDDESIYQADIEWLADRGITRGCNPPFEDEFCPGDAVTRGQMAAFLVRALGLAGAENRFTDDDSSVFEADIGALAAAGITRGCNPPDNDRFCPRDPVTRGQMAAFLNRAFGLRAGESPFTDDNGSVFEADIAALAGAGITRGCNPPDSDRFCPDLAVTRGQMAAFLHRAEAFLPET